MEQNLTIYEPARAIAHLDRGNYKVTCGSGGAMLKRDTDFGNPVVKKTGKHAFDKPILYKSGAEKLAFGFGLCQRYTIESKIEEHSAEGCFFHYLVRCDLVRPTPQGDCVISNGFGSSNTGEGRNGFKSAADSANSTLKMAQKRALVSAAIAISGLSDLFTQDMENDDFMESANDILRETPDSPITPKQIKRIFAIAGNTGLNTEQAKQKITAMGFASTKDITQKDYDRVCEELEGASE